MAEPLAIDGGRPVRTTPLPPWPAPGDAEVEAVTAVLRSGRINYWTGGEARTFEHEYAASVDRRYGIAVANGTVALEIALRAFRVGPGDEVIVPARSFIATASCAVAVGAVPVIADIDPDSGNLTAETARAALTERTRAIIPVHVGGWPVDMAPIMDLATERGLFVLEDCAQAHGATYRGRPVGSIGHAAAFSFCQDKILPLGEGGLIALDDEEAYRRAWAYKDHGKSLAKVEHPPADADTAGFRWLHDSFGTNARMGELEGALGRVGLAQLAHWVAARRRNALRLATGIADLPGLRVPMTPADSVNSYYRLYAFAQHDALSDGWSRDRIANAISAEGIPCRHGSCAEMYREEAFAAAGIGPAQRLPVAASMQETSLSFFVHPTLTDADMDDAIAAVCKVMAVAAAPGSRN
ncbi:MAG: DegT/DnrJ/EryC1/StrS family aminotransferase [Coriobacteriia bacterium]|nr:DegT/DnrJ/EryC1/StrS family aminotransferase [Coriobacteriia bacterium]